MSARLMLTLGSLLMLAAVARAEDQATTRPMSDAASAEISPVVEAFLQPVGTAQDDNALRQKLKERHNTAVRLLQLRVKAYRQGISDASPVFDAARLVAEAKLDLSQNADERKAVLDQLLAVSNVIESRLEKQLQSGFGSEADLERARLARQTAEVELLKLNPNGPAPATQPR